MTRYVRLIIIAITLFGCHKDGTTGGAYPSIALLRSHLIDGPWHFYSSTITYPSGSATRYIGTPQDTVIFHFDYNGSVFPTKITSYLRGLNDFCGYTVNEDSMIICTPAWRQFLSDTIKVASFTDYLIVLKTKHTSSVGVAIETDTLKKIRFWNP